MNRRMLLTLALALPFPGTSAFAQAAAESALLNAHSATVTVKAGTTLGSALNHSVNQLAGRVAQTTSPPSSSQVGGPPRSTIPVKSTPRRDGTLPAQGPMIASIQGAATSCASTSQPASTPRSKTVAESPQTNCGRQDSAGQVASQKSKSVITLSFSK